MTWGYVAVGVGTAISGGLSYLSDKKKRAANSSAAATLSSAEERAMLMQINAEDDAREIQREASEVSQEYIRTGSQEAKDQLENLSMQLNQIIGTTLNESRGMVDQTFADQMMSMRKGFDDATGSITSGFDQAQQIVNEGFGSAEQLQTQGVQDALATGATGVVAGQQGTEAFAQSALDPNNPLFERRVAAEEANLDQLLASRGQFNSGTAIKEQVDLRSRLEAEEQQNQVNRQLQLAQLGQTSINSAQDLHAGLGQNLAQLRTGGAAASANLEQSKGATLGELGLQDAQQISNLRGGMSAQQLALLQTSSAQRQGAMGQIKTGLADLATGNASSIANLNTGLGSAQASSFQRIGEAQALSAQNIGQANAAAMISSANSTAARNSTIGSNIMKLGGTFAENQGSFTNTPAKNTTVTPTLSQQATNYYNQPPGTGTVLKR